MVGLLATVVGLSVAIWTVRQAKISADLSRSAAEAAQMASVETRDSISRTLTSVDLERAIAVIDRLKVLHREQKWEVALERYSGLRAMLADIAARIPNRSSSISREFRDAAVQLRFIEDSVNAAILEDELPKTFEEFNERLNVIQDTLQQIASQTHFAP
ncbi:MAG: hypothetical protein IIB17_12670 [Chloroflexi bacterium]|nr:hypothetical protein [Chloroflexota bacterium]